MTTIGIAEAKAKLSSLVERVAAGEEIVITKNGERVARLVPMVWPWEEFRPNVFHASDPSIEIVNGRPVKTAVAPHNAPPTPSDPPSPRLRPQPPGLTLAEILKAAR